MAEVQQITVNDGRLVHSTGAESSGSTWWSQSSWFAGAPAECPNTRPRVELPAAAAASGQPAPTKVHHAGGAAAQCRFSGRCAVPIATTAPVDGSPLPAPTIERISAVWKPRGTTCDGSVALPATGGQSKWRFDLETWAWKPRAGSSGTTQSAAHQLAARRWGDGRDELLPAAQRGSHTSSVLGASAAAAAPPPHTVPTGSAADSALKGFAAVGGLSRQKELLHGAVVLPLRHPRLFQQLGVQALRGVLLHGPPGTGKTFLMPALAEEAHAHLQVVDGAEVAAGSEASQRLKRAFGAAKANAPAVLFIDNLEALAPAGRGGVSADDKEGTHNLISLLDELAGSDALVVVVAATSQRGEVCPAVLRPGRLGTEVPFGTPSSAEREDIVRRLSQRMPLAGVDAAAVAAQMRGFVAADCAAVVTEAATACVAEAVAALPQDAEEADLPWLAVGAAHFAEALHRVTPSALRALVPEIPAMSWGDIGGHEDVKRALRELIEVPLRHPELLAKFGSSPARGALMYGPPGCGKTLLAQAAAAQCGANFISIRGPELLDKWLGESERAVRELFATARAAAPCIIFFDELDSLAVRRGDTAAAGGDAAAARLLMQLLVEMDGFTPSSRVFVLGATNRPDALDPALLRPGRLDALLEVPLPDEAGRLAILQAKLRRVPVSPGMDVASLAALTPGMSGADLAEVCRNSCQLALREHMAEVENTGMVPLAVVAPRHFEDALASARRSVFMADAADAPTDKQAAGSASDAGGSSRLSSGGSAAQQQFVQAAAAQAVKSIRTQVDERSVQAQQAQRIATLEAALVAAGIPLP